MGSHSAGKEANHCSLAMLFLVTALSCVLAILSQVSGHGKLIL